MQAVQTVLAEGETHQRAVIKINALCSMLSCCANWAAVNMSQRCFMRKTVEKQFGLKDPAKDDLEIHGIQ